MENFNEENILKTLSFIVEHNNRISRYTLDKFITKSFLFNQSFNVIPLYLFENQLAILIKEDNQSFISLTEKGISSYELFLNNNSK
jgi:hypothetical protein